jgi:hypothetical protein
MDENDFIEIPLFHNQGTARIRVSAIRDIDERGRIQLEPFGIIWTEAPPSLELRLQLAKINAARLERELQEQNNAADLIR